MFTAKIFVNNRKAFEGLKSHLEYLCQLNGATISYDEETPGIIKENKIKILYKKFNRRLKGTYYRLKNCEFGIPASYVTVWRKGCVYSGSCTCSPEDEYDERIARMLCYSRAFGWKDIEQELFDILD